MPARRVLAVAPAVLVLACFQQLPDLPAGTDSEASSGEATAGFDATSDADASTGGTTVVTTAATTAATTPPTTTDADPETTAEPLPPPPDGVFACTVDVCPQWTPPACEPKCGELDAPGRCALETLRDRTSRRVEVRRCSGECELTGVVVRGSGTDEAMRQVASELRGGGLGDYQPVELCELREPGFFTDCLAAFTPDCADPDKWFTGCEVAVKHPCM